MDPSDLDRSSETSALARMGRIIDLLCFVALLAVMGTVIYGFALRAHFEHSYYAAAGIAVLGALVIVIGLAQQTIAARDAATWRHMAQWQIRAAHRAVAARIAADPALPADQVGPDSAVYQEFLVEALIYDMQNQSELVRADG